MSNKLTKEEFLEKLKTDRDFNSRYGRKHITEGKMVLPPCHYGFQVYTRELSFDEFWDRLTPEQKGNMEKPYEGETYNGIDSRIELKNIVSEIHNIPTRAISLMWNQRSVDTFLGLPFNIASYGLLLEIIAKEVRMVPDQLIGNLGDVHLYSNHIEQAKEQIGRYFTSEERTEVLKQAMGEEVFQNAFDQQVPFGGGLSEYFGKYNISPGLHTREPYPLPTLKFTTWTNMVIKDGRDLDWIMKETDTVDDWFQLENYQSHPTIKAPLSN